MLSTRPHLEMLCVEPIEFTAADREQMEALGINESRVWEQIDIFRRNAFYVHLKSPCTLRNGVRTLSDSEIKRFLHLHREAERRGRFSKFVPASGAATRMFQSLLQIYHMPQYLMSHAELLERAERGVAVAQDFVRFIDNVRRFAFANDLEKALTRDGHDLDRLLCDRRFQAVLEYLLTERGLNYSSLPKGLLKFHRYRGECRTAFEEHLAESYSYAGNGGGGCSVHFTVSPEHETDFRKLWERVTPIYAERYGCLFDVSFSHQCSSTDTIAVDMEDRPFRDHTGRLVFRPGGHGSLLKNLNALRGDLVFVKNIDNLVPDRLKKPTIHWKCVLGGFLAEVQERVHTLVRRMRDGAAPGVVEEATLLASRELAVRLPEGFAQWPRNRRHTFLLDRLDRPIRVCGVVANTGEPGGAPFWVEDATGTVTLQIVEKAQVDFSSQEQTEIWNASTHFNPVDLVCGLKDPDGKPYDLNQYIDPAAVFISRKSKGGKDLKALELPGLWNGAMAGWITIAVEVPHLTFNPVKTIFDLLRPEHSEDEE